MVPVLHAAIAAMDVRLMVAGRILANEQEVMERGDFNVTV
jgi:hypothetical protein